MAKKEKIFHDSHRNREHVAELLGGATLSEIVRNANNCDNLQEIQLLNCEKCHAFSPCSFPILRDAHGAHAAASLPPSTSGKPDRVSHLHHRFLPPHLPSLGG